MPRQFVFFGRPIPRLPPRRRRLRILGFAIVAFTLLSTLTSVAPSKPRLPVSYDHKPSSRETGKPVSENGHDSFPAPVRPPPRQKNDSFDGISWWADHKWLAVPFSDTFTLDDERVLLPPLPHRPAIYCYYEATAKKPRDEKDAESELLLTWRRAWWSQGFRPFILSAADAMSNPAYPEMQRLQMGKDLRADMMRWLAWDAVGGGLLAHHTLLPLDSEGSQLLSYLRQGEYPSLTRWRDLYNGLFAGQGAAVSAMIRMLTQSSLLKESKAVVAAVPENAFTIDPAFSPLAYYSPEVIERKYARVANTARKSTAKGLHSLNTLINTHLHIVWQNRFAEGIRVLKPLPEHTTAMVSDALELARSLAGCADTPMPASCPPNLPRCTPCVAMSPMSVTTPSQYSDSKRLFIMGTVPHPWTLALLDNLREDLDIAWMVQESARDPWLTASTQRLLGAGVSGNRRVLHFKEAVAGAPFAGRSLWLIAERGLPADASWHLGFAIPTRFLDDGTSLSPVPADRLPGDDPPPDRQNGPVASDEDVARERALLGRARAAAGGVPRLWGALEAWNLADTEAWRFARAVEARARMEREGWEAEEGRRALGAPPR